MVDSSTDSDNHFSDGYFAYAYLGGPFMVMTSGNNGYGPGNMDAVTAHETGHIFRALDQYGGARQPCEKTAGYLNVANMNSQYGDCSPGVPSIMRGQIARYSGQALDQYAAGQIGGRDSDGDGILDPLDTELSITIDTLSAEGNSLTVSGLAEIIPYPAPEQNSITINELTGVQYRIDGGDWQPAAPADGLFDGTVETYHFTVMALSTGFHTVEIAALDSAGNVSNSYATETSATLDPIDGALNTELALPDIAKASDETPTILNGVAYQMQGRPIVKVEYRINGSPWQPMTAQDGAFDSDYEPFVLTLSKLESGVHLIEARATDADGKVEMNFAGQEIEVAGQQAFTIFLPAVMK